MGKSAYLPRRLGYLLVDGFSMMAFVSATEPLRIANRIAGQELYQTCLLSVSGSTVRASNGMRIMADYRVANRLNLSWLAVCSGFLDAASGPPSAARQWLHGLDQAGCMLGGIDTGCIWLAEAGLLGQERITLHWESLPSFRERFPGIRAVEALYELGERHFSCAGGTAAMDMTLAMIARSQGQALATAVSEQLLHERMRAAGSGQRQPLAKRLRAHHWAVVKAAAIMETHIDRPLPIAEIADQVGLSVRQLQRLFMAELAIRPLTWYRQQRLLRARQLLQETALSMTDVMAACGFGSPAAFSRAYKKEFAVAPSEERSRVGTDTDDQSCIRGPSTRHG